MHVNRHIDECIVHKMIFCETVHLVQGIVLHLKKANITCDIYVQQKNKLQMENITIPSLQLLPTRRHYITFPI